MSGASAPVAGNVESRVVRFRLGVCLMIMLLAGIVSPSESRSNDFHSLLPFFSRNLNYFNILTPHIIWFIILSLKIKIKIKVDAINPVKVVCDITSISTNAVAIIAGCMAVFVFFSHISDMMYFMLKVRLLSRLCTYL